MKKVTFISSLLLIFTFSLFAQNKQSKPKAETTKKISKVPIFSCGICNGKAINLVKPLYSQAAKAVGARGSVSVSVLIDEKGNVVEAKAVLGHLLLRPSSIKAALESKFEPIKIGGKPVMVYGTIVYNFSLNTYNWLEIGSAVKGAKFVEMLPVNFTEERQLYETYKLADHDGRVFIFNDLRGAVELKLNNEHKKLWLFKVGMLLSDLQEWCCGNQNIQKFVIELKALLINIPKNISPALISKLNNIVFLQENPNLNFYSPSDGNKIYQQLKDIMEKLPLLGN